MALINYEPYLDGDVWPSESGTMSGNGQIEERWVGDMPPQYAASALAKLVRFYRDSAVTESEVAREEDRVRASQLGQMLAARALSIDDFTLTEYVMSHGGLPDKRYEYEPPRVLAVAIARTMLGFDSLDLDPETIGALASQIAKTVYDSGLAVAEVST